MFDLKLALEPPNRPYFVVIVSPDTSPSLMPNSSRSSTISSVSDGATTGATSVGVAVIWFSTDIGNRRPCPQLVR
jgi:hypothetical protein